MPRYDYECESCQRIEERLLPLSQSDDPQVCQKCQRLLKKVILSAPAGFVSAPVHYTCPKTGVPITSKKAHEENLARHGCRVLEKGEHEEQARFRAAEDAALERDVDETVDRVIEAMPADKKERLANELGQGADLGLTRTTPTVTE